MIFSSCSESSDWEAKFYQIQSKYLLLLNELHNPQVSESDSRKEMVGQLLKDVVEAADRPQLNYNNAQFDRCVQGGPSGRGQAFVDIEVRVEL